MEPRHETPSSEVTSSKATEVSHDATKSDAQFVLPPEGIDLAAVERSFIEQALKMASGNQSRAARLLGISRYALRYRLQRDGVLSKPGSETPQRERGAEREPEIEDVKRP
jgi:DNA-binding NtrC family response regulator